MTTYHHCYTHGGVWEPSRCGPDKIFQTAQKPLKVKSKEWRDGFIFPSSTPTIISSARWKSGININIIIILTYHWAVIIILQWDGGKNKKYDYTCYWYVDILVSRKSRMAIIRFSSNSFFRVVKIHSKVQYSNVNNRKYGTHAYNIYTSNGWFSHFSPICLKRLKIILSFVQHPFIGSDFIFW